jgi:hypothetical protein
LENYLFLPLQPNNLLKTKKFNFFDLIKQKNVLIAPPDVMVEKTWVHASIGSDAELVCILHSDPNSDVSFLILIYLKLE